MPYRFSTAAMQDLSEGWTYATVQMVLDQELSEQQQKAAWDAARASIVGFDDMPHSTQQSLAMREARRQNPHIQLAGRRIDPNTGQIAAAGAPRQDSGARLPSELAGGAGTGGGGAGGGGGSSSQAGAMRAVLDWLPKELVDIYVDSWVKHGDPTLAWGQVRTSGAYERHFPGIKRDDGTLRMSEHEYLAHRDAFRRSFTQWGLNPQLFESHHVDLIQGDVSIQEFRQRMDAKVSGVMQNLPQVREQFGQFYGINAMDDRALIAAALDPDVGLEILQGRITASQVGAEAAARGFDLDRGRAEHLAQGGGLDQAQARQLFSTAQRVVPQMQRFAGRFRDQPFGREQFEEASVFGDAEQQQRMRRLGASEQALFRQGGQIRQDRTGMAGLRRA